MGTELDSQHKTTDEAISFRPPGYLQPGAVLGDRYRIERQLGEGGLGVVYEANDLAAGMLVAVRVVRPEIARSDLDRGLMREELEELVGWDHRNILKVYDVVEEDGQFFYSMERLSGHFLRTLLGVNPEGMPLGQFRKIFSGLLAAVEYVHDHGVVHPDLRPESVFVTERGEAKLLKTGLTKPVLAFQYSVPRIGPETVAYIAPEQQPEDALPDFRSDVYSLGIMIYELLTGKRPGRSYDPIEDHNPQVPTLIDEIVLRCLRRDPNHRFQSVAELRTALPLTVFRRRTTATELQAAPTPPAKSSAKPAGAPAAAAVEAFVPFKSEAAASESGGRGLIFGLVLLLAIGAGACYYFELGPFASDSLAIDNRRSPVDLALRIDEPEEGALLTVDKVTVKGMTRPGAKVEVSGSRTEAGPGGEFSLEVSLRPGMAGLDVLISDRGELLERRRALTVDLAPPVIRLDPIDEKEVSAAAFVLKGEVIDDSGKATARLNGRDLELQWGDRFREELNLKPGDNELIVTASDAAGRAAEEARVVIRYSPPSPDSLSAAGDKLMAAGNPRSALLKYGQLIELAPRQARAYWQRSEAYRAVGSRLRAINDLDEAIALAPKETEYRMARGRLYAELEKQTDALRDFDQVLELKPGDTEALCARAGLHIALGNFGLATRDLDAALDQEPRSVAALVKRGEVRSRLGRHKEAVADLSRALELEPGQSEALFHRAVSHQALGELSKAMDDYDGVIKADRKAAMAYLNRGSLLAKEGQLKAALEDFEAVLKMRPSDVLALTRRAGVFLELGQDEKAVEDLSAALRLDSRSAESYYLRGLCYAKDKEFRKAILDFNRAIQIAPEDASAYFRRGLVQSAAGENQLALRDLNMSLRLGLDSAEVYMTRAQCLEALGRDQEALKDYRSAAKLARGPLAEVVKTRIENLEKVLQR